MQNKNSARFFFNIKAVGAVSHIAIWKLIWERCIYLKVPPSCKASMLEASLRTQLLLKFDSAFPSWVTNTEWRRLFTVFRNSPDKNLDRIRNSAKSHQKKKKLFSVKWSLLFISSPSLNSVRRMATLWVLRKPLSAWSLSMPTALCTQLRSRAVVSTTSFEPWNTQKLKFSSRKAQLKCRYGQINCVWIKKARKASQ